MSSISTQDVPKWVSQWAALANQRALKKAHSLDIPLTDGRYTTTSQLNTGQTPHSFIVHYCNKFHLSILEYILYVYSGVGRLYF